ncbi:hypothetical protein F0562_001765 [Nyssa sinensis]|uniref:Uncharacterized protein n=1 Tax=Nyssa sinensis TaxID=561372 RepID=A0A5J5C923_9ASTE|nr:hypothetical protein F0562_001765 [Nyssa sinensis]
MGEFAQGRRWRWGRHLTACRVLYATGVVIDGVAMAFGISRGGKAVGEPQIEGGESDGSLSLQACQVKPEQEEDGSLGCVARVATGKELMMIPVPIRYTGLRLTS